MVTFTTISPKPNHKHNPNLKPNPNPTPDPNSNLNHNPNRISNFKFKLIYVTILRHWNKADNFYNSSRPRVSTGTVLKIPPLDK